MSTITPQTDILSSPPFVVVDGVFNMRAIGGSSISRPGLIVKPLRIFRSADLSRITENGTEQLRSLGIKVVFDLRTKLEILRDDKGQLDVQPGIRTVNASVYTEDAVKAKRENLANSMKRYQEDPLQIFKEDYIQMLGMAGPALRTVFTHLRDNPDEPCLFHCSAGKDRTGLVIACILMVLGVDDEDIVHDYGLTNIGYAPLLEILRESHQKIEAFRQNWDGYLNMVAAREDSVRSALGIIRENFGGVQTYLKGHAGLSDEDLEKVRRNLLTPQ